MIQISGFPRTGSSLLLQLLAGTVTNLTVKDRAESHARPGHIAKCPFALIRRKWDPEHVLLLVRNPRHIVTSTSHPRFKGQFLVGWKRGEGKAPYGLEDHWKAAEPFVEQSLVVRYEDLIADPDSVQRVLGEHFRLRYRRPFSAWPFEDLDIAGYWTRNGGLGEVRPIEAPRDYDVKRVRQMEEHDGFREMCRALGYVSSGESEAQEARAARRGDQAGLG